MAAGGQVGGYEFKVKGKLPTTCQCLICHELIRECTELPCHHPYCKSCLLKWEEQKREENEKLRRKHVLICLLCKREYQVEDKHYSKVVDKIVTEDLEVLCKHNEQGCPWTGAINDFPQHANTDCPYVEVKCRFTGCDVRIFRKAQQKHEENCPQKEMNCNYCRQVIKVSRAQEHYGICDFYPTLCTNQKCQHVGPKNQIADHQSKDCLYQNVSCSFADVGCQVKVYRKDLPDHEISANVSHTTLLFKKHLRMNKELTETKEKLNVTSDELYAMKEQLNITNKELLDMKTKLQNMEAKFKKSNDKIDEIQTHFLPPEKTQVSAKRQEQPGRLLASQQHKPISSNPQPLPRITFQKGHKEINFIFSSTQPLQNYASRIENLSLQMEVGQIYFHQENIFFKLLPFRNNYTRFYVDHETNIDAWRNDPSTVFSNDNLVLLDYSSYYDLFIQIANFDGENSELFLVSRKHQQKHQLKYDRYNNIPWNDFKNEKNEMIFYLKKK